MTTTKILPLYFFFERLRQNGFVLGINEYAQFIKALQSAYGLVEKGSSKYFPKVYIYHLSKLLWLKPGDNESLFEELFEITYLLEFGMTTTDPIEEKQPNQQYKPHSGTQTNNKPQDDTSYSDQQDDINTQSEPDTPTNTENAEHIPIKIALGQDDKGKNTAVEDFSKIDLEKSKFILKPDFYPIDHRKVAQSLKVFPTFKGNLNTMVVDLESTIAQNTQDGLLTQLIYQKAKVQEIHLLFLIDHRGSMIAFHNLAHILKNHIEKRFNVNPGQRRAEVFYFYNVPHQKLFKNQSHTLAEDKKKLFQKLKNRDVAILFLSDAGAARGTYMRKRVEATLQFIEDCQEISKKIAWLNPLPTEQWKDTSAAEIAKHITMLEAHERGIIKAIDVLRGKT